MAKRKIEWTHKAQIKLFQILDYYEERNKSKSYSIKLYKKITKQVNFLTKYPELGRETEQEGIRGLIIDHYIVFYETKPELIIVHLIWDGRQNPEHLKNLFK